MSYSIRPSTTPQGSSGKLSLYQVKIAGPSCCLLYLRYHGEAKQEPDDTHDSNEDFFTLSDPEALGIQINDGCDKSFHANKLRTQKEAVLYFKKKILVT